MHQNLAVDILEKYEARFPTQDAFTRSVSVLCQTIVSSQGIELATIEARTKTPESLREKLGRSDKVGKYKELDDVTDLSGVRIVLFMKEDCERIITVLKNTLNIDEVNSTNKEDLLDPDRFGYTSSHLVASYGQDRAGLIEFQPYLGMKAEIQVRTVLQHAWAAIDWKLRYKNKSEVPKILRRRLYRISALLESADDGFSALNDEAGKIRLEYESQIKKGSKNISVDGESINIFLKEDKTWTELRDQLKKNGVQITSSIGKNKTRSDSLLKIIDGAGISDLSLIKNILTANSQDIVEKTTRVYQNWMNNEGAAIMSPEGALRLCILLGIDKKVAKKLSTLSLFAPNLQRALEKELD